MRFHVAKIGVFSALLVGGFTACGKDDDSGNNGDVEDCGNGMDDDGDGDVDLVDSDCASGGDEESDCGNGEDDDGDEDVDCDDDDCEFEPECVESDCGNGEDDDGDGDVDCEDRDCNGESECDFFEASLWFMSGGFGYDASTGEVVGVVADGNAVAPYIQFYFLNEDQSEYCAVVYEWDGSPTTLEPFVGENGENHGGFQFDIANDPLVVTDYCTDADDIHWDVDSWGGTAAEFIAANFPVVGLGVGEPGSESQDGIDASDAADQPYLGGSGFLWADGTYVGNYQGSSGCAVDGSFNVSIDAEGACTDRIPAEQFADGSGVPATGWYSVFAFYVFGFGS